MFKMQWLAVLLFKWLAYPPRKPDLVVGEDYLRRWHLLPRNNWFNVYLHRMMEDDEGRELHDHPYVSVSILLDGELKEHLSAGRSRIVERGHVVFRRAVHLHRLEVLQRPTWTLFITGPRIRQWGFQTRDGWKPWSESE